MRRPRLTPQRVEALRVLADRARSAASARRDGLFSGTRGEREQLRKAIRFVDDLVKWSEDRSAVGA